MQGLIEATKRGTRMTKKRKILLLKIFSVIPAGTSIPLFKHDIFVMPGAEHHPMVKEAPVSELLIEKLKPQNEHYTL
jgi:hypothetical protein